MTNQLTLPSIDAPANLLSGAQTVESLRDSGYTATERALAELIDNSYEAGASNVVLVIVQQLGKFAPGQKRASWRAVEMYVADDGEGMAAPVANQALAFGAGTRRSRKGIGRFGMGLPQASVSQARRIDAWTWTEAYGQALHTRVDLDDIAASGSLSVPWPKPAAGSWIPAPPANEYEPPTDDPGAEIPPFLLEEGVIDEVVSGEGADHGTIIGWSKLDRTTWTTANAVADHIAFFLGRAYRRFLSDDDAEKRFDSSIGHDKDELRNNLDLADVIDVEKAAPLLTETSISGSRRLFIRVVTRTLSDDHVTHERELNFAGRGIEADTGQVLPNDPEYLLSADRTNLGSWPDREGNDRSDAPFELHRKPQVIFVQSRKQGDERYYPVFVTVSHSKKDSRVSRTGDTPFGKHAKRNQGLSVVRADRELLLIDDLSDEAQRRFIGIQVDFAPQLDEVFGVTNNKQEATQLSAALKVAKDNANRPLVDLVAEGAIVEESPVANIYPVARAIRERFSSAFKVVLGQQEGSKRGTPSDPSNVAPEVAHATDVDRNADPEDLTEREQGALEESRQPDYQPAGEQEIADDIGSAIEGADGAMSVYTADDIKVIASRLAAGSGYAFLIEFNEESPAFFRTEERIGVPEARGSSKIVWLNMSHPIWEQYLDDMRLGEDELDQLGESELREIIRKARGVIINMLIAWSRIELGGMPTERQAANQTRERWGAKARHYVRTNDEPSIPHDPELMNEMFGR